MQKITTQLCRGTGGRTGIPSLWNVKVNGNLIDPPYPETSRGRVLKMGRFDLPVLDNAPENRLLRFSTRADAARSVAEWADQWGII